MATTYPGKFIEDIPNSSFDNGNEVSPIINNIHSEIRVIPKQAQFLKINTENAFQDTDSYDEFNVITHIFEKRRVIHFQGIIRLPKGNYFVLSGGDYKKKCAQLFVVNIEAYRQNRIELLNQKESIRKGPIGNNTNYAADTLPREIDRLVEVFRFNNEKFWHAGGISVVNDLVAVPIENNELNQSEIRFIDFRNPEQPIDLVYQVSIKRENKKAGAVGLIRIPNGRYICGVWSDSDKFDDKKRKLDLYYSKSDQITDGFEDREITWGYSLLGKPGKHPQYQSIQFFLQKNDTLYIIGLENSSDQAPILGSNINRLRVYKITFPGQDIFGLNFELVNPGIELLYEKTFNKGGKNYNFDATTGIHITPDKHLGLYASHHWMKDDYISIAEFYPDRSEEDLPVGDLEQSEIHLYEKK